MQKPVDQVITHNTENQEHRRWQTLITEGPTAKDRTHEAVRARRQRGRFENAALAGARASISSSIAIISSSAAPS